MWQSLGLPSLIAIEGCANHEEACHEVTKAQDSLAFHPTVSQNAHQGRHEDAHDALHGIEPANVRAQAYTSQISAHGGQVGSPNGKLKEIE